MTSRTKAAASHDVEVGALYFDTYEEASQVAQRIRQSSTLNGGVFTSVESSPYGGWRVVSMPAEVYADLVTDGLASGGGGMGAPTIKGYYGKILG